MLEMVGLFEGKRENEDNVSGECMIVRQRECVSEIMCASLVVRVVGH